MRRQVVRVLQNFLNSMEFVDVELLGTDLSAVKNFFQYARCAFLETLQLVQSALGEFRG